MLIEEARKILEDNGYVLEIPVKMEEQPDGVSCGATSLSAIYDFYGDDSDVETVSGEVKSLSGGGTSDMCIGSAALKRGYSVTIYTCNPNIIDRTWTDISMEEMLKKLKEMRHERKRGLTELIDATIEFLENGGKIVPADIDDDLIETCLEQGAPVIAGVSCTYLYGDKKEYTNSDDEAVESDTKGDNTGHFIVIHGIGNGKCMIADPTSDNNLSGDNYYDVDVEHLIKSIYLGACTNEGSIILIEK